MGKTQLEELEKHGKYFSVPQGISMWPMIRPKRDIVEIHRLEKPAKRYDLVLYIRGEEKQGILHRVLHVREKDYIIAGDNCWQKEYVPYEQAAGIAVRFRRNGKWIETDNLWYLIYAHLWTDLFFIRRPLLFIRDKAKRVLRRLLRSAGKKRE